MDDSRPAARDIVLRHGWNAVAFQILNPGMQRWFAEAGDAVVGYASHGNIRVVAGAPVCAADRLIAVADEFEHASNERGERVIFFGAGTRLEQAFSPRTDHHRISLGAQPVWNPQKWPATLQDKASLRAQLNRARNKHVRIVEWPAHRSRNSSALNSVREEWLAMRGLPPMAFLVTTDLLGDVEDRRIFVAHRGSDVIAYLVASPVPARNGWLVEQWPRTHRAPNGTTHLLIDAAMNAFRESGCDYATLGLAPLSPRGGQVQTPPPVWLRFLLQWVRAHGRRFYNFRGLEAFKAGLQPAEWEPLFAIAQGRRFRGSMLRAVAGVFAGGSPGRFVMSAVATAAVQELHALGGAVRQRHTRES